MMDCTYKVVSGCEGIGWVEGAGGRKGWVGGGGGWEARGGLYLPTGLFGVAMNQKVLVIGPDKTGGP